MPFMNQPPGSLLSSNAVMTYGRAIHALRRFTQASLNKEPGVAATGDRACDGTAPQSHRDRQVLELEARCRR